MVTSSTLQFPLRFGRYDVLAEIGRGGMAELYLARLTGIAGFVKLVAIKKILPHLARDARFVEMFLNEGRIAARLSHPNVCQVFELGEVDGEPFLAMEYLEGAPLAELLDLVPRDPVLRLRLAAGVIGQGCDGLHYAHELRAAGGGSTAVVHRDVSPHNLFVTVEGVCKLLDFGVSKLLTDADQTRSGLVKGKLPYMPPEQLRGEPVDARADVFASGVVLWEALTGERLFLRDTDYLISKAILEDDIPGVRAIEPRYPAAVDAVIAQALHRDRAYRTPTARALADELRRVADGVGGALEPAEIAGILRTACAPQLADRARLVASALAPEAARDPSRGAVRGPFDDEPSVTQSIALRHGSVAVGRPRRRRWPWLALAIAMLGLTAAAIVLGGAGAPTRSPGGDRAGALAAVVVDAGPPVVAVDAPEVAAVAPDAASDPAPVVPRPSRPSPARVRPRARDAERDGFYSVDSTPYATIFVDGKRLDQTPLFRVPLPAGTHRVRAVRADGKARTFTIEIGAGKHVSSGTLTW